MAYLYPKNIETKLGFDMIRGFVKNRCYSSLGKREVESMVFDTDRSRIIEKLNQTSEIKKLIESGADLPEVSFNDLETWLVSLKIESSYATPEQFIKLSKSIQSFANVRTFFLKREGNSEENSQIYPFLASLFQDMEMFPEIKNSIERIIDKSGFVKDSASPELAEIRKRLSGMQGSIAKTTQRIYAAAVKEGIADKDTGPTLRDGRIVIPVASVNKRNLQGIIHDESASGKTVFIEPAETVEMNNRIREMEIEEKRIIVRLLISLSDMFRPYIDNILKSNNLLGKLDFLLAKARFAIETGGELPTISRQKEIDWYGALHPVLLLNLQNQGKETVPLNIRLEGKQRILIISGPNAGGKSVALKTVGIIQYMFQCGMLPSLHSNSHMGVFNKIFIDIGDEQNMENDLSTYSSHLKNMRQFILHSDGKSLILIDEIGSGTEPNIGSSLAKAILIELSRSSCFGIVTTHYHKLKKFAEEDEHFVNGAMLYDRQKLQPTFQLSIGNAGSSFALEIATKIGLPKKVIDLAKLEVGEDYVESDRYLMDIARDRKYWQMKRESIKDKENRLESLEEKYEKLISELSQKKKEIISSAQEEAKQLIAGANKKIENTIHEIKKAEAEREKTKKIREELDEYKKDLENDNVLKNNIIVPSVTLTKRLKNKKKPKESEVGSAPKTEASKELAIGNYARMEGSREIGQILSISGKEAELAFGNIRTKVKLSKLRWAEKPQSQKTGSGSFNLINGTSSDSSRQRQLNFSGELDIRGYRADEALDQVIHFIDDALQFGIKKVRILHGTGSGILRQIVRQQLSITPGIAKYEDEDVRMGGNGITVVTII